ncbi:hypothetical protein MIR68_006745 [Amoeboaphelidium protococcarum]|nr:hypothetical protein MIR68_006745 [Amoeboaphelidium protococcarum]
MMDGIHHQNVKNNEIQASKITSSDLEQLVVYNGLIYLVDSHWNLTVLNADNCSILLQTQLIEYLSSLKVQSEDLNSDNVKLIFQEDLLLLLLGGEILQVQISVKQRVKLIHRWKLQQRVVDPKFIRWSLDKKFVAVVVDVNTLGVYEFDQKNQACKQIFTTQGQMVDAQFDNNSDLVYLTDGLDLYKLTIKSKSSQFICNLSLYEPSPLLSLAVLQQDQVVVFGSRYVLAIDCKTCKVIAQRKFDEDLYCIRMTDDIGSFITLDRSGQFIRLNLLENSWSLQKCYFELKSPFVNNIAIDQIQNKISVIYVDGAVQTFDLSVIVIYKRDDLAILQVGLINKYQILINGKCMMELSSKYSRYMLSAQQKRGRFICCYFDSSILLFDINLQKYFEYPVSQSHDSDILLSEDFVVLIQSLEMKVYFFGQDVPIFSDKFADKPCRQLIKLQQNLLVFQDGNTTSNFNVVTLGASSTIRKIQYQEHIMQLYLLENGVILYLDSKRSLYVNDLKSKEVLLRSMVDYCYGLDNGRSCVILSCGQILYFEDLLRSKSYQVVHAGVRCVSYVSWTQSGVIVNALNQKGESVKYELFSVDQQIEVALKGGQVWHAIKVANNAIIRQGFNFNLVQILIKGNNYLALAQYLYHCNKVDVAYQSYLVSSQQASPEVLVDSINKQLTSQSVSLEDNSPSTEDQKQLGRLMGQDFLKIISFNELNHSLGKLIILLRGDLSEACIFLVQIRLLTDALILLRYSQELQLNSLIISLFENKAIELKRFGCLAQIQELQQKFDEAFQSYQLSQEYEKCLRLCHQHFPSRVKDVALQRVTQLQSQSRHREAINLCIEFEQSYQCLMIMTDCQYFELLDRILPLLSPEKQNVKQALLIAYECCVRCKDFANAERIAIVVNCSRQLLSEYVNRQMWSNYYSLSCNLFGEDASKQAMRALAQNFVESKQYANAEQIYLVMEDADAAIQMYMDSNLFHDGLRLIRDHFPDQYNQTAQALLEQFKEQKDFVQQGQIRMILQQYKQAVELFCKCGQFEQAYSVVQSKSMSSKVAVQVLYLWAKSLKLQAAVDLLDKHEQKDLVLQYAQQRADFGLLKQYYCETLQLERLNEISLLNAQHLESLDLVNEALEEYSVLSRYEDCFRVCLERHLLEMAEQYGQKLEYHQVDNLVSQQLQKLVKQQQKLQQAEELACFFSIHKQLIDLYVELAFWKNAFVFSCMFCVEQLDLVLKSFLKAIKLKQVPLKVFRVCGKLLSSMQQAQVALLVFLQFGQYSNQNGDNNVLMEDCLDDIVFLFIQLSKEDALLFVKDVGNLLVNSKYYQQAGRVFQQCEMIKDAVSCYLKASMWTEAKELAKDDMILTQMVTEQYQQHLLDKGDIQKLSNVNAESALQILFARADWNQCVQLALQQPPAVMEKWIVRIVSHLTSSTDLDSLISVLQQTLPKVSLSVFEEFLEEYCKKHIFAADDLTGCQKILSVLRSSVSLNDSRLLGACYYYCLFKNVSGVVQLQDLCFKLSVSLFRFTDIIPLSYVLNLCGTASKLLRRQTVSYDCYSALLDLMDDPATFNTADQQVFKYTYALPQPALNLNISSISQNVVKDIRNWTLKTASSISNKTNLDREQLSKCVKCQSLLLIGAIQCGKCKFKYEQCIVTGSPVLSEAVSVRCSSCNQLANKDDWNHYLAIKKACPWCQQIQKPVYGKSNISLKNSAVK